MRNTTQFAILFVIVAGLISSGSERCFAQDQKSTTDQKSGVITGMVKLDGKPAPGVTVIASPLITDPQKAVEAMFSSSASVKSATDSEGRYRLDNVPAGKYTVAPFAPALVSVDSSATSEITVAEGGADEGVDFSLSPGAVITGKITDGEGRPVVAERISLKQLDKPESKTTPGIPDNIGGDRMYSTDDRGIYRIYGLRPGRYIVSAGKESDIMSNLMSQRVKRIQTYYPGVTDETKAKSVQLAPGAEAAGIDIQFSATDKGFIVSGRVVDAERNTPIAGAMVAYSRAQKAPEEKEIAGTMPGGFTTTNDKGEFRFEAVTPGSYRLEATSLGPLSGSGGSQFYADPLNVDVQSANVDKLDIKVHRGATISGIVVIESADNQDTLERFGQLMLMASVSDPRTKTFSSGNCVVGADGSFKIGGLKPGKVSIRTFSMGARRAGILRIERNGADVQGGVELQSSEEVSGLRVVLTPANGVIRGHVTVQGGALAPGAKLTVRAQPLNADPADLYGIQPVGVSANGTFVIENISPGNYQVEVFTAVASTQGARSVSSKQTITVTTERPAEVELVLDLGGKGSDK